MIEHIAKSSFNDFVTSENIVGLDFKVKRGFDWKIERKSRRNGIQMPSEMTATSSTCYSASSASPYGLLFSLEEPPHPPLAAGTCLGASLLRREGWLISSR